MHFLAGDSNTQARAALPEERTGSRLWPQATSHERAACGAGAAPAVGGRPYAGRRRRRLRRRRRARPGAPSCRFCCWLLKLATKAWTCSMRCGPSGCCDRAHRLDAAFHPPALPHSQAEGGVAPAAAPANTAAPAPRRQRGSAKFRFWHDERRFKGPADRCIVQQALFDAGGGREARGEHWSGGRRGVERGRMAGARRPAAARHALHRRCTGLPRASAVCPTRLSSTLRSALLAPLPHHRWRAHGRLPQVLAAAWPPGLPARRRLGPALVPGAHRAQGGAGAQAGAAGQRAARHDERYKEGGGARGRRGRRCAMRQQCLRRSKLAAPVNEASAPGTRERAHNCPAGLHPPCGPRHARPRPQRLSPPRSGA